MLLSKYVKILEINYFNILDPPTTIPIKELEILYKELLELFSDINNRFRRMS